MSWAALFLALQAVWVMPTPPPATPVPTAVPGAPAAIVDRIVEHGGERTRLSLFSNGVAIVSMDTGSGHHRLFKRTLQHDSLVAYLTALEDAARQIRALHAIPGEKGGTGGTVSIRLVAGPGDPIVLRFPRMAMMPMAIGHLGTILDDLQAKVLATPPGYDEVMSWKPQEGDVVEMSGGQRADVIDVRKDGTVIVEYEDLGLTELVTKGNRAGRIRRVLSRAPR